MPVSIIISKTKTTAIKLTAAAAITPTSAPLPHDFALKGIVFCHTRYNISPTSGKQKLRTAKPALGASFSMEFCALCAPFL